MQLKKLGINRRAAKNGRTEAFGGREATSGPTPREHNRKPAPTKAALLGSKGCRLNSLTRTWVLPAYEQVVLAQENEMSLYLLRLREPSSATHMRNFPFSTTQMRNILSNAFQQTLWDRNSPRIRLYHAYEYYPFGAGMVAPFLFLFTHNIPAAQDLPENASLPRL